MPPNLAAAVKASASTSTFPDNAMDVDEKPDAPSLAAAADSNAASANFTKDGQRILKEMPLYFTTELAEHLTLLQYPHRWKSTHANYDPERPIVVNSQPSRPVYARMKPKVGALELSVPIEGPGYPSYSAAKGKEMGRGVESGDLGGPPALPGKKRVNPEDEKPLERMTFRADSLADQTNYCIGIVQDNEVHLTPLLSTMQLRTSLTYLDHNKARERERKMRGGHDEADDDSTGEESEDDIEEGTKDEFQAKKEKMEQMKQLEAKPEAKALTVSMRSEGSSGDKGVGRATAALFAAFKADTMEPWVSLDYYSHRTDAANHVSDALFCTNTDAQLQSVTHVTDHLVRTNI